MSLLFLFPLPLCLNKKKLYLNKNDKDAITLFK